jgi:chitin disaccharide deacetylase
MMLIPKPVPLNPKGRYLIVNADDYNTDSERNRGILQAARDGMVTSVSVIANLHGEDKALAELTGVMGARIGIHLNLTSGRPLVPGLKTLTDDAGVFYPKQTAWRKALLGKFAMKEVEEEFAAQIEHLTAAGITPDHIDGNNHIHTFPGIARVAGSLAQRYGISRIRLPQETFSRWKQWIQPKAVKKYFIGFLSCRARPVFHGCGLRFTDYFAGIQFPAVTQAASLKAFLARVPEGTTELMCHPGYHNRAENPFSTSERERELEALTCAEVLAEVRRRNIHLISYSEL